MECHNASWVRHCFGSIADKMECTGRELDDLVRQDGEVVERMRVQREELLKWQQEQRAQQGAAGGRVAGAAAGGAAGGGAPPAVTAPPPGGGNKEGKKGR